MAAIIAKAKKAIAIVAIVLKLFSIAWFLNSGLPIGTGTFYGPGIGGIAAFTGKLKFLVFNEFLVTGSNTFWSDWISKLIAELSKLELSFKRKSTSTALSEEGKTIPLSLAGLNSKV